ncbi:MAG: hypothetical protein IJ303_00805 [Clostridia bacterium]|nr:hypothetical protein [Clostridia bacterium]
MKKFSNHIFVIDGTVADSMGHWSNTMIGIVKESGVMYPPDLIKIITPLGYAGIDKYFLYFNELV